MYQQVKEQQLWYNCCSSSCTEALSPHSLTCAHTYTHTHAQTANHSLVQVLRHWDYWWLSLPGGLEAGIWQTQIKGCLELPAASNSISRLPSSPLPLSLLPTTPSPFFISPSFGLLCCHGYAQPEPSCSGGTCQGAALRSPDAGHLHRWPVSHAAIIQFWLWLSLRWVACGWGVESV